MEAYRIIVNGRVIGVEFGRSPQHAIERYAAGSTYDAAQMTAKRGVSQVVRPDEPPKESGDDLH